MSFTLEACLLSKLSLWSILNSQTHLEAAVAQQASSLV